jgi:hypothetical protein
VTKDKQEELAQSLEGFVDHFSRVPPAPCGAITSSDEKEAALIWAGAAIYRWLKNKKGKQHVRVVSFETWWEKDKRRGKFFIAVVDGKDRKTFEVSLGAASSRVLGLTIDQGQGAEQRFWEESAVSYSPGKGWNIVPMPEDSRVPCVKGIQPAAAAPRRGPWGTRRSGPRLECGDHLPLLLPRHRGEYAHPVTDRLPVGLLDGREVRACPKRGSLLSARRVCASA